jgi:hypothetical protein
VPFNLVHLDLLILRGVNSSCRQGVNLMCRPTRATLTGLVAWPSATSNTADMGR